MERAKKVDLLFNSQYGKYGVLIVVWGWTVSHSLFFTGSNRDVLIVNLQAKAQQSSKDKGQSASKSAQAAKSKGAKAKKKTWTKTKVKDKLNNDVFLDQKRFDKICSEMPKILCLTRSVVMEKFKVNGSVARGLMRHLAGTGDILPVGDVTCSDFSLFRGKLAMSAQEKRAADEAAEAEKAKKGKK